MWNESVNLVLTDLLLAASSRNEGVKIGKIFSSVAAKDYPRNVMDFFLAWRLFLPQIPRISTDLFLSLRFARLFCHRLHKLAQIFRGRFVRMRFVQQKGSTSERSRAFFTTISSAIVYDKRSVNIHHSSLIIHHLLLQFTMVTTVSEVDKETKYHPYCGGHQRAWINGDNHTGTDQRAENRY
jgi:hypothetical protein